MKCLACIVVFGSLVIFLVIFKACDQPSCSITNSYTITQPTRRISTMPNIKNEISTRILRWQTEHRTEDFLWLFEHAIPPGSSKEHVRIILGPPLRKEMPLIDGGFTWDYIECNPAKGQNEGISIIFNKDGKVAGLGRKNRV